MAEKLVKNIGNFTGIYLDETVDFRTNEVVTTIITGVTATKTADKTFWINGPLTYTIVVDNTTGTDLTNVLFKDDLDIQTVTLDTSFGVKVDGAPVIYSFDAGQLSLNIPLIQDGVAVTITFQVIQI